MPPIESGSWKKFLPAAVGGLLAVGAITYLYASRIEVRRYRRERLRLSVNSTHQLSILHISDLHLKFGDRAKVDFLSEITNQEYDLVVLTGDIFQDNESLAHASALLKRMPRLGAYAVLGNHDYYYYNWFNKTIGRLKGHRRNLPKRDIEPVIAGLEKVGYKVLRNELVRLPNDRLSIVGIDYPYINEDRLEELVQPVGEDDLLLALFHLPYNLEALNRVGVHLAFGGHTHGGQIRVPGYGALWTDSELSGREASGLVWRGSTAIHISRGLGADPRTNFRLFCPPAATVIDLIRAEVPAPVGA
jgi:predicted MPP superfamily phosphohydrolase